MCVCACFFYYVIKNKKSKKENKKNKKCMFVFISGIFLQRDGKA
jgi:hypothetical protein